MLTSQDINNLTIKFMQNVLQKLGPGLLYAAAAIGVSHLVQSTRAGADFGYQLLIVVILANVIKYPFFQIGPTYTAFTGQSLLTAYQKIHPKSLVVFIIITLATMFSVQAAVTIITGGLLNQLLSLEIDARLSSSLLLVITAIILIQGRYNLLDKLIKIIIFILTITTIITLILTTFVHFPKTSMTTNFDLANNSHLFFLIALVGWMPAPMDVPIWHGLWSMAKNREDGVRTTYADALVDFKVGYITTTLLACGFLLLGARVLHGSGIELSSNATVFAGQLIGMYTKNLGQWSYPLIAVAAFTTMLSTTMAVMDAMARILREAIFLQTHNQQKHESKWYNFWIFILCTGTMLLYLLFFQNMRSLVDFATTISFLIAPVFATMNYLVMHSQDIPLAYHPKGWYRGLCLIGLIFLICFSLYYLYIKYFL